MTPVAAVMQAEPFNTVASARTWGRQLATIRAYYGDAWFSGRLVLALGCGREIDELTTLGARVVQMPDGFDPDCDWQIDQGGVPPGRVDLVLHLGLLQRLDASHASLRHACTHATNLVIETAVCDAHDELLVCVDRECSSGEKPSSPEHSSRPEPRGPSPGMYPSSARIERLLIEHGMLFQRLADSRCNGPDRIYDWLPTGTGRVTPGQRRLWFARKG